MVRYIRSYIYGEDGAVTVDWVVLTAAVVGLAVVAYIQINSQTMQLSDNIAAAIPENLD